MTTPQRPGLKKNVTLRRLVLIAEGHGFPGRMNLLRTEWVLAWTLDNLEMMGAFV